MNMLRITCAILGPLVVGCTGVVGDGSGLLGAGSTGTVDAGGSSAAMPIVATGGNVTGAAGSGAIVGPTTTAGSGDAAAIGGMPGAGGNSSGGACSLEVLPAAVQTMLTNRCATCHGPVPLPMAPSLVSYANLTAPSKSDPTKTNAVMCLSRMQNAMMPMPPAPGTPATPAEISALQDFIAQGYPKPSCPIAVGGGGGGGTAASGGAAGSAGAPSMDPLTAMPICTSKSNWTGGDRGSASMNPGMACNACHTKSGGEGPTFSIAGTVYPTGHEPDLCNSAVGGAGVSVVIVGADGQKLTLTPNSVGNFSSRTAIKTPYKAMVTYQGRERLMVTAQTSGDCNSCHGQTGTMMAPGRVTVP